MRTTIRLEEHLLRRVKRYAAQEGKTMTLVFQEALQAYLARSTRVERAALDLPRSGHGGTLPGVDLNDAAQLYDLMDGRA